MPRRNTAVHFGATGVTLEPYSGYCRVNLSKRLRLVGVTNPCNAANLRLYAAGDFGWRGCASET